MPVDCINPKPGLEVASLTDIGRLRLNNEDSCLYWEPDSDEEFARKGRLAVIADGMGGYEGGQEASRLAVETGSLFLAVSGPVRSSSPDARRADRGRDSALRV